MPSSDDRPSPAWALSLLGPFDASVTDRLEAEARALLESFARRFHEGAPESSPVERSWSSDDSWPRGEERRFRVVSGGAPVGSARCEYVYWNPRDGESWTLELALSFPGSRIPITVIEKDNQPEGRVAILWDAEHAPLRSAFLAWLNAPFDRAPSDSER